MLFLLLLCLFPDSVNLPRKECHSRHAGCIKKVRIFLGGCEQSYLSFVFRQDITFQISSTLLRQTLVMYIVMSYRGYQRRLHQPYILQITPKEIFIVFSAFLFDLYRS